MHINIRGFIYRIALTSLPGNPGKTLELHYKEYFGALPWRGFTKFVVDSIITVRPAEQGKQGVDR